MKKRLLLAAAIMLLFPASCGNSPDNGTPESSSDSFKYVAAYFNNYDEGRIIGGFDGSVGTPSKYLDYETMEKTVLCSKPNCGHTANDCVAKNIGACPMLTPAGIYFFKSNYGVKEEKDGKRNFYINSKLCKVSLETSEIETIASFTDCAPADARGYVLYNNKLYFTADNMDPASDSYGGISYSNIGGTHYLCSIDLENGEYKNYGSVYDGDKGFKSAHASSSATIIGVYNEKMLVNYEFCKSYEDMSAGKFTELLFEFDFENDRLTESNIHTKPVFVSSDTIVYYDDTAQKCIITGNSGEKTLDIDKVTFASIQNNKLFIRDDKNDFSLKWYDLSDSSEHIVKGMNLYMPVHLYNGSYILTKGDDTIKLTEKELLALDKEV